MLLSWLNWIDLPDPINNHCDLRHAGDVEAAENLQRCWDRRLQKSFEHTVITGQFDDVDGLAEVLITGDHEPVDQHRRYPFVRHAGDIDRRVVDRVGWIP